MPQGRLWEIVAGSFGIAAAIVLIGGWIFLRFQRDRQHFRLMQSALERGITALPGAAPGWVISLRQGLLALALGIGVAGAGKAMYATAAWVEPLPDGVATQPTGRGDAAFPPDRPPPPMDRMDDRGLPGERGRMGPPPPRPSPALERWQRIQSQRQIGLIAMCAGAILTLLGLVRVVFSLVEKKYANESPPVG